jgi:hypothetical protein
MLNGYVLVVIKENVQCLMKNIKRNLVNYLIELII